MEKYRLVLPTDQAKVGIRHLLAVEFAKSGMFDITLSRIKIARIKQEFQPVKPHIVFLAAALDHRPEYDELRGFMSKLHNRLRELIFLQV